MRKLQIKITSVPEGQAPVEIRRRWIGLKLVGVAYEPGIITGEALESQRGCIALIDMVLDALESHSKEAYEWWCTWKRDHTDSDVFLFDSKCYEELKPKSLVQENRTFLAAFKGKPLEELVDYIMKN